MSFSEPLPATIAPVACMTCGLLVTNEPAWLDLHLSWHQQQVVTSVQPKDPTVELVVQTVSVAPTEPAAEQVEEEV